MKRGDTLRVVDDGPGKALPGLAGKKPTFRKDEEVVVTAVLPGPCLQGRSGRDRLPLLRLPAARHRRPRRAAGPSLERRPLRTGGGLMMIKPNKRRFAIGFYVLTGFTPWGVELTKANSERPSMTNCSGRWIMSCGHVMTHAEIRLWTEAGLFTPGPLDALGRQTAVAGPHLAAWVSHAWHDLRAATWRPPLADTR
jgi:hypothetical protein